MTLSTETGAKALLAVTIDREALAAVGARSELVVDASSASPSRLASVGAKAGVGVLCGFKAVAALLADKRNRLAIRPSTFAMQAMPFPTFGGTMPLRGQDADFAGVLAGRLAPFF